MSGESETFSVLVNYSINVCLIRGETIRRLDFFTTFDRTRKKVETFLLLSIILCFLGECDGNGNNHYDDKGGDDK